MRARNILYLLATILFVSGNALDVFCAEIGVPTEPEQLKEFLLKGYNDAKSVLDDVRIEYEEKQVSGPVWLKKFNRFYTFYNL